MLGHLWDYLTGPLSLGRLLVVVIAAVSIRVGSILLMALFVSPDWHYQPDPPHYVTMSDFDRLQDGASFDQVLDVLKKSGIHRSHTSVGNMTSDTWVWRNPNGSRVLVIFNNGRLSSKSQQGLQ